MIDNLGYGNSTPNYTFQQQLVADVLGTFVAFQFVRQSASFPAHDWVKLPVVKPSLAECKAFFWGYSYGSVRANYLGSVFPCHGFVHADGTSLTKMHILSDTKNPKLPALKRVYLPPL